jgi:hypothetical protein
MRKFFLILSLFIALLTTTERVAAVEAEADKSSPLASLLREILLWLPANFALPSGASAPQIRFLSKEQLAAIRYDREAKGSQQESPVASSSGNERDVLALYDDRSETIFLASGWTGATAAEQSILVHEMVHHLQKVSGQRFDCPMAREKLAYEAQDRWLGRSGSGIEREFDLDKFTLLITSACFY